MLVRRSWHLPRFCPHQAYRRPVRGNPLWAGQPAPGGAGACPPRPAETPADARPAGHALSAKASDICRPSVPGTCSKLGQHIKFYQTQFARLSRRLVGAGTHLGQRNLYQVVVRANVCVTHSLLSKKGVHVTAWCVRFPRLCFEVPPAVRRASSTI